MSFLIVNVTRGIVDGHYFEKANAEEVGAYWAERCPGDYIAVCEVTKKIGTVSIPDNRFMARVLAKEERARA